MKAEVKHKVLSMIKNTRKQMERDRYTHAGLACNGRNVVDEFFPDEMYGRECDPQSTLIKAEEINFALQQLHDLSPDRVVSSLLMDTLVAGVPIKDAAQKHGLNYGTARSHKSRAVAKLTRLSCNNSEVTDVKD